MKILRRAEAIFDDIMSFFTSLADFLVIFTMVVVCMEVVMRYFFKHSLMWVFETTSYSMLFITYLAAPWLLKEEGHTVMDLVSNRLRPRIQAMLNFITSIIGAFVCLVITWYGAETTLYLLRMGIREQSAVRPPSFILYIVIPIGSLLLSIQFLRRAHKHLNKWRILSSQGSMTKT